jgi:hypothetical protein
MRAKDLIKAKPLTKGHIREKAIERLQWQGCTLWPQNNLAVRGRKFIGRRGVSDIIGWMKDGKFLAVEVKTITDFLSDEQKDFLNDVKKAGGVALIACQGETGGVELKAW